ncbi:MAG: hypothetical protein U1F77_08270 [Kiritimatiellia bacterium]
MKRLLAVVPILLLCVGAAPPEQYPLDLMVPAPNDAVRLAWYANTPDETVVQKIQHLERATREANPTSEVWAIYLTPDAALVPIKGWQADMNRPDTPLPQTTLKDCLTWLSSVAGLRFEVVKSKVLIDVKEEKRTAQPAGGAYGAPAAGAPSAHP